jgi:putative hemolysin
VGGEGLSCAPARRRTARAPQEAERLSELLIILALVVANGVFSGAEIAIVSLRKTRIEELLAEKRNGAEAIKRLRKDPERFLAVIQIGITVIGTAASAFGGASLSASIEPILRTVSFIGDSADEVSLALVVVLISFLQLVIGELVPKSLGLRSAEPYALLTAGPLVWLSRAGTPLVWLLTKASNLVLRMFKDSTSFSEARLSPGEIQQIVDEATEAGALDATAGEIASRAIDFGDLTVAQVMVPRNRVVALPRGASVGEIERAILEHGHERMPVYEGMIDDIVGYVTIRDLMAVFFAKSLLVLEDAIRPAFVVPQSIKATDLLSEMRRRRQQLAVVVDEMGSMSGIATMEDLLEELVGEIASEHDAEAPATLMREATGATLVRGDLPVRDVNRELELELPEGETWSTIAGLVLELAGRIPREGARVKAPDGTVLEVVAATPRAIRTVRIVPPKREAPPPDA